MRHKKKRAPKLSRTPSHRKAMIKNLATQIIIDEKVETTASKAKAVTPLVNKLITIAKKKDKVIAIREIKKLIQHDNCSLKIFNQLLEKYKTRDSGFTRVTPTRIRKGDAAPMVQIELV